MLAAMTGVRTRRLYLGLLVALSLPASLLFAPGAQAKHHPVVTPVTPVTTVTPVKTLPTCGSTVLSQSTTITAALASQLSQCTGSGPALVIDSSGSPITINLAGHSLIGNGSGIGLDVEDASNVTIANGTITGYATDVYNSDTQNVTYTNMHLLNTANAFYDANSLFTSLNNSVLSGPTGTIGGKNKLSLDCAGIYTEQAGGDVFSHDTISGFYSGIQVVDSQNNQYLNNTISSVYYGVYFGYNYLEGNSNTLSFIGNQINLGSYGTGFYDDGNENAGQWVNNVVTGGYSGYELYDTPVYMRSNQASGQALAYGWGEDDSDYDFTKYSQLLNNSATYTGCGFCSFGSPDGTFTGNSASFSGVGMFVMYPYKDIITGNTFKKDWAGLALFDPSENLEWAPFAQSVSNNNAQNNTIGMAAFSEAELFYDGFAQPGGDNFASNDSWFDCYNVSCTGTGTAQGPSGTTSDILLGDFHTKAGATKLTPPAPHAYLAGQPVAPSKPTS